MRFTLVLAIVILSSCQSKMINKIDFKIAPKFSTSDDVKYVSDEFDITTLDTLKLIIDWKAFSHDCYYEENRDLIRRCNQKLFCIIERIKFNEFIIEDEYGEMNFLTNAKPVDGEVYPVNDINCMEDWFTDYEILPKQSKVINTPSLIFDYLRVRPRKKKVRLHYLFKPNPHQSQEGYKELILSSDWFIHK